MRKLLVALVAATTLSLGGLVVTAPAATAATCGITQVTPSKNAAGHDITTISYRNCNTVTVYVTVHLSNGTSIGRTAVGPHVTKTWVYNARVGVVGVST